MEESIFTKIIKGEIPAHKIYEDDKTLAFLDVHPIQAGHVLVVPKKQVPQLWDLEREDYLAVMTTCQKVARRLREILHPTRVGMQVIGLHVAHAHVHVLPFNELEQFLTQPDMSVEPDHATLTNMATRLAF